MSNKKLWKKWDRHLFKIKKVASPHFPNLVAQSAGLPVKKISCEYTVFGFQFTVFSLQKREDGSDESDPYNFTSTLPWAVISSTTQGRPSPSTGRGDKMIDRRDACPTVNSLPLIFLLENEIVLLLL